MAETRPQDVVAAVIRVADRFLVGQRPANKAHGGLWEFPGGKVTPGESFSEAVARELHEELKLAVVETGPVLFTARDERVDVVVHFLETKIVGEPVAVEHDEIRWCSVKELCGLTLAPSDTRFVREMLDRGISVSSDNRQ